MEVLAISSNSVVTHPQDGPEKMAEDARSFGTVLEPGPHPLPNEQCILHECNSDMLLSLQGILSDISMMSLKKLPKPTKQLALQSFTWPTAACSCSTMASLTSLGHLMIQPCLVSWLSGAAQLAAGIALYLLQSNSVCCR